LEQEQDLIEHVKDPTEEQQNVYGDEAWEMSLADRFVTDSDGVFVHVGRTVRSYHILGVTRAIQKRLSVLRTQDGFDGTLSLSEFKNALQLGGITWLEQEQVAVLFSTMASADSGGLSLSTWLSRFRWEPMQAAMEVQRALECGASPPASRRRRGGTAPQKFELAFPAFQTRLLEFGVGWLSIEQQRVIFDTIDFDKSGTITEDELHQIQEQREKLEAEREETLAAEIAEAKAAEAEAAALADAAAAAAEREKQAEVDAAKAAMAAKGDAEIEKERKRRQNILEHSHSNSSLPKIEPKDMAEDADTSMEAKDLVQDTHPQSTAEHAGTDTDGGEAQASEVPVTEAKDPVQDELPQSTTEHAQPHTDGGGVRASAGALVVSGSLGQLDSESSAQESVKQSGAHAEESSLQASAGLESLPAGTPKSAGAAPSSPTSPSAGAVAADGNSNHRRKNERCPLRR